MSQLITASIRDRNEGPWILSCNYCMWSSLDVGMKFNKPQNLRQQVDRMANGGKSQPDYRDFSKSDIRKAMSKEYDRQIKTKSATYNVTTLQGNQDAGDRTEADLLSNPHAQFQALKSFYKDQIIASGGDAGSASNVDYSSPSSLTRIMNLYANPGNSSYKRSKPLSTPMREAQSPAEGLSIPSATRAKQTIPEYIDAASPEQQLFQYPNPVGSPDATHVMALRPMSTPLRTKRSKRCAACKHILVKPEFKVTSTRYRIKLTALNYIPLVTLKPVPTPNGLPPPGPDGSDIVLQSGKPSQWIMTLRNPLFENVNVTLGSPSLTPGKHAHKVTILCPVFSIGKNGDVWDDALTGRGGSGTTSHNKSLTTTTNTNASTGEQVAGKIYESGRNWTSVVIEVVPAHISVPDNDVWNLDEDEDIIEIPVRVRLDWTATEVDEGALRGVEKKKKSEKLLDEDADSVAAADDDGKREVSYWMVLGIGRVDLSP